MERINEPDAQKYVKERVEVNADGCWIWKFRCDRDGYARMFRKQKTYAVHKFSYVAFRGEFDRTLHLDHLCRVRNCVNPDHLEPVTPYVNWQRGNAISVLCAGKTHCAHGHEFTPENTYRPASGRRHCRKCMRLRAATYRKKCCGVRAIAKSPHPHPTALAKREG